MKKTFLIAATFFGIATASAQSDKTGFEFGVRGGANFANITTTDYLGSPDGRTNFYAGLVSELPLHERFSLQGEVFYSGQGYKRIYSIYNVEFEDDVTFDYKFKADYIQVPLLAKFYIVEGLSVAAGPQFGFKVNEKIDHNTSSTSNGVALNPVNINTFDIQGTAGLEYKLKNGLFIQGRYSYGFSELIKNSYVHYHTSVFSAGLGYMF